MRWFRFYNDAMRHPKVAQLTDAQFRLWVEVLCVASENDGIIPPLDTLKTVLRRRLDHLKGAFKALLKAGLIDALSDGYAPHGWDKRQYKSDSSTERSRKHRENCNVAATPAATAPDTDTDTEAEKIPPKAPRKRWVGKPDSVSDELWQEWRGFRKSAFTQTALKGFQREADKAGWSLSDAMRKSMERGWQGFEADWVKGKTNGQNADKRDGVAKALDRQLGFDDAAGEAGRYDAGEGGGNRALPAPRSSGMR